jgi:hypothetical protein
LSLPVAPRLEIAKLLRPALPHAVAVDGRFGPVRLEREKLSLHPVKTLLPVAEAMTAAA